MPLQVIELDPAETFASLRDRLLRAGRGRVVLRPSPRGDVLGRGVNLVLLRRLIERERLEVGLITTDSVLASRARALGLPTFPNLPLAEHYRPGWWRARRPRERLGFAPGEASRASRAVEDRAGPVIAGATGLVCLVLLLLIAAGLYWLPQATIVLRPATRPLQIITQVTADPSLATATAGALPAGEIRLTQAWEATGPASDGHVVDRRLIRAQALQGLGSAVETLLASHVAAGSLLVPGSARFEVTDEAFALGEDGGWRLSLQTELTGLTVSQVEIERLALGHLAALLPPGFAISPATFNLSVEGVPGRPGDLQLTARAEGKARPDAGLLRQSIRGRRTAIAEQYLDRLPLADDPRLDVYPAWWVRRFQRLPLTAGRIRVEILP